MSDDGSVTTPAAPRRVSFDPDEMERDAFYRVLNSVVVPRPIAWVCSRSAEGVLNLAPHSFYTVACELLGVEPAECVFLDDLGINLKPAREMGMTTIKVGEPAEAIAELAAVLGISLT